MGFHVLIALWSLVVLGIFIWHSGGLASRALDSLWTALLAAGSVYLFWFSGFRISRLCARRLPAAASPLEQSLLEFALGTALVIGIVFAAGLAGLYTRAGLGAVLAPCLLGRHGEFLRAVRARLLTGERSRPEPLLLGSLLFAGAMTLVASLSPATAQDALVYHLAVPQRYIEEGGIHYVPESFFAQFPQNVEMLFTLGLLFGGESLAQWYHWMLGVAATLTVAALARAIDRRGSGLLAAAVFGTIPTAALVAGWAYVDLGVVFYASLSTLAFVRWLDGRERAWLVLAAVAAGVTAGIKYTGGLQGLLLAGAVLVLGRQPSGDGGLAPRRGSRVPALRAASGVALIVALAAAPWWIKNLVYTGNPLFPFAYGLLGGRDWDPERASVLSLALSQWGGDRGLISTLLLPWRVTMSGEFFSIENFDGVIGGVFLAAVPLLLLSARVSVRHRVVLAFLIVEAVIWCLMTRQVRFLLPGLALASALIGATFPVLLAGWPRAAMRAVVSAGVLFNVLVMSFHFAAHNPLPVVLGLETRDRYLEREVPGGDFRVFASIEESLPEESYVLFGSLGNPGFLCKRRYHADAFFENRTLALLLAGSGTSDDLLSAFRARGFTHLLFRAENVLDPSGRKSDIPPADQGKLAAFLNRHGRLVAGVAGTYLYEIGAGEPRGSSAVAPPR
jgi:hypothetical protein